MNTTCSFNLLAKNRFESIHRLNNDKKFNIWFKKIILFVLIIPGLLFLVYQNLSDDIQPGFIYYAGIVFLISFILSIIIKVIVAPLIKINHAINMLSQGLIPNKIEPQAINIYKKLIVNVNEDIEMTKAIFGETQKTKALIIEEEG